MASLKEVKVRINSVSNTRKITSAMKMVASAKLHKAQSMIGNFIPYQEKLDTTLTNLLASDAGYTSPYAEVREVKRVAIVAFASNSNLCGAFNSNIVKELNSTYNSYLNRLGKENVFVYSVGKKVDKYLSKSEIGSEGSFDEMADKPTYEAAYNLALELTERYLKKEFDEIVLIYHHFKSMGSQVLTKKTFLPFDLTIEEGGDQGANMDYIVEPSRGEILSVLIPQVLNARLYSALLDSNTSEHAARTMAMQIASDNADELIQELTVLYNNTRQQVITNELLDILGGASALQ